MKFDKLVNQIINEKGGGDGAYRPAMLQSINMADPPQQRKYKIDQELASRWRFTEAERAQYFQQLGNYGLVNMETMQSVFQQMLANKNKTQPQSQLQ